MNQLFTNLPDLQSMGVWSILLYAFEVAGLWMVFEKAGEKGWKAIIPIYNLYILFKITGASALFLFWAAAVLLASLFYALANILFLFYPLGWICTIAAGALLMMVNFRLSQRFGHGFLFALGLWFLNPIFLIILGFGSSRYHRGWMY